MSHILARRLAITVVLAFAMMVLAVVPALAGPPADTPPYDGKAFGSHVAEHNHMFTGEHNPGVHHKGITGWAEHHMEGHSH